MLGCAPGAAASWKEVRGARQATGVIVSCGFCPLSFGYAGAGLATAFAALAATFIAGSGRALPRRANPWRLGVEPRARSEKFKMSSLPERNRGACKRSARGVVRADRLRYADHIALGVGDYGESLAFYPGKFGRSRAGYCPGSRTSA